MIYFTGDTHGSWDMREPFLQSLSEKDKVICLGDLGWDWDIEHINRFCPNCEWLSVLGNHENYTLIEKMPIEERYGGKVRKMKDNVYFLLNGEYYIIEGHTFFVFGGAASIDSRWRVPYVSWWPQEIPTSKEVSHAFEVIKERGWKADFFLTHTCEDSLADRMFGYAHKFYDVTAKFIGEIKSLVAENNGEFKWHLFGHHHANAKVDNCLCLYEDVYDIDMNKIDYLGLSNV